MNNAHRLASFANAATALFRAAACGLLVATAAAALTACGGSDSSDAASPAPPQSTASQPPPTTGSTTAPPPATPSPPSVKVSVSSIQFGNQRVGSKSTAQVVTVTNNGTVELSISSVKLSTAGATPFALTDGCGIMLGINTSCTLKIVFSPVASGTATASVTIATNAATSPRITLQGTGTASVATVSSASLGFYNQVIGTPSPPQTLTITNTGTAPLDIASLTLGGANAAYFAQSNTCTSAIAPGSSCSAAITFNPTAAGSSSATVTIASDATTNPTVSLSGTALLPFPPFAANDPGVILDIGTTALNPRNTWTSLPTGFTLGQVPGLVPGTVDDSAGFTPNSGGYIENSNAFPNVPSTQGTLYMRLQRAGVSVDNSMDAGATFYDSTGNATGGFGASAATAFTVFDGANNILQWTMSPESNGPQILDQGSWVYPGYRYGNSHSSTNLDPVYTDIVLTWSDTTYWAYFDGVPIAYGTLPSSLPSIGQLSQIVIGGYLGGSGSVGQPLGPFSIQRFQVSTKFSAPPQLSGEPMIGFYGDSFVVQGAGVSGDVPGLDGSPTVAQVNAVQAQFNPTQSPGAYAGTYGQDGFISRAEAYALKHFDGYLQLYTAAQTGHGWAYTGMGGTTAANTPAIDDFSLGKTGFSDALDAAKPDYIFAFGSVNDVNNGVPTNLVGDVQAHFDYWANNNPNLKGIYYVETLSWELATAACTSQGGPAGWIAEMTLQRTQLRAAFGSGYLAGTRQVPVTYIQTYQTWVQGPNSLRFLIATNPDNTSESSNSGTNPNGHPDAEGNIQIVDAYVWPNLTPLIH